MNLFFILFVLLASAEEPSSLETIPTPLAIEDRGREPFFSYRLVQPFDEERNYEWPAVVSIFIPGLGQWWEGQYRSAAVYSAYGFGGLATALSLRDDVDGLNNNFSDRENGEPRFNQKQMWFTFGSQAYQAAGFVSAFHAFRTSVEAKKKSGEYEFLTHEETTGDLMLAPLRFDYLLRPTTFLPLLLIGAAITLDDPHHYKISRSDSLFVTGLSFNAGVSEEAFFRGTMMPYAKNEGASDFWSNAITAVLFGAAHIDSDNPFPLMQTLGGYYFGYLTQKNQWTLSEAVFVHFWWDIIAIGAELGASRGKGAYIPLINMSF